MKFTRLTACFACFFFLTLLNTSAELRTSQSRKTQPRRARAVIETTVNFIMGASADNPGKATLHLKNIGSIEATQVLLLNSVGISADQQNRAEQATFHHALAAGQAASRPTIGAIDAGQRDFMELHVPKLAPGLFAQLENGRSRVYVAGTLHYADRYHSYEQEFCWVFGSGDPNSGRKCGTHNELKDLGPTPRRTNPKSRPTKTASG